MARKSLRPQLNQIRAWVRQGRTDAWIAHQLEVSAAELREFRSQHGLAPGEEGPDEVDLRDEIEAEIEAAAAEDVEPQEEAEEAAEAAGEADEEPDGSEAEGRPRRRRRGRRGRGGRGRREGAALQGTFDHGETDGFGLWLDPAVEDDPTYTEHWAGHRRITVTIEPDQIVIRRSG